MKIDFNFFLKDLDNKETTEHLGKFIAAKLATSNKGNPLKYFDWAMKLYSGQPLELDKSDFDTLKNFISEHQEVSAIAKAQLILTMKEV